MRKERFKDIFWFAPKSKTKAGEGLDEGRFPFYTSSQTLSKWIETEQYFDEALIFGTGGSASIHYVNESFSTSTDCIVTINRKDYIKTKFVFYYLLSNIYILERGFKGAGLKHISKKYIEDIEIPIPEVEIQNKIVAILDKTHLVINKRIQIIEKYENLKWSQFYTKFKNWPSLEEKNVEDIASDEQYSLSSGPFGSNLTSKDYVEEAGVMILRGKNITSGKLDLSDIKYVSEEKAIELKRSQIKPNDIVIVAVGSSGKALKIPYSLLRAIISQNFNKVTCNTNLINPTYFEHCFNSNIVQHQLKSIITDAGRTFLSLTNIKEIKIPIPPIHMQNEFEKVIVCIDNLISIQNKSKIKAETLLLCVSKLAFEGKLAFNTAVELEVLLENDYTFFTKNSNTKSIELLLERLDKDELNEKKFYEQEIYDKAKGFVFELLKEGKVKQVFDENTNTIKLTV